MLTGVIDNTSKPILFTINEASFTYKFMTDSVYEYGIPIEAVELPNTEGFIFGRTHDNRKVAIFVGKEKLKVKTTQEIKGGSYVISYGNNCSSDINEYKEISFVGGTLNRIFQADRIDIDPITLETKMKEDKKDYTIEVNGETICIEINSNIEIKNSLNGKIINNSDVTLTLKFEKSKKISDSFKYYQIIKKTLSFMCFRKNVGFDSIQLLDESTDYPGAPETLAFLYVNDDKKFSVKDWQTNIHVDDLGTSFPFLIKLFFDEIEKSQSPIIGFLPENDDDLYHIYPSKVKEICSSLEAEYNYRKMDEAKNDCLLDDIKKSVLSTLRKFKKEHPDFPESSYNLLKTDVEKWSLSLRDRMTFLFQYYSEELLLLNESADIIDEHAIQELAKYRNSVTHRGFAKLETSIINTAFYAQAVIYCSILERIGMTRDKIKSLCPYKLLK